MSNERKDLKQIIYPNKSAGYWRNKNNERQSNVANFRTEEKEFQTALQLLQGSTFLKWGEHTIVQKSDIEGWFEPFEIGEIFWIDSTSCFVSTKSQEHSNMDIKLHLSSKIKAGCKLLEFRPYSPNCFQSVQQRTKFLSKLSIKLESKSKEKGKREIKLEPALLEHWRKQLKLQKIENDAYNPQLIISDISSTKNGKNYKVIRDDILLAGTKQRVLIPLIELSENQEFVYASPIFGLAQVCLEMKFFFFFAHF